MSYVDEMLAWCLQLRRDHDEYKQQQDDEQLLQDEQQQLQEEMQKEGWK